MPILRAALAALAILLAPAAASASQPPLWDAELALPAVEDLNPDPDILEIRLEARIAEVEILPGKRTRVWSYNGGLPGPLLKLKLGDRLIVHFTNNLPEDTTIHWHGMRVPNAMDGAPNFPRPPVAARGGRFTYDFVLRDAGTFWYHPHANSAAQVGRGLYGPIIVTDPNEQPRFADDLVLILSDIGLDEAGQLLPSDSGGTTGDLFGREGNVLLVNGKVLPTLKVRQGQQQRWRVINAARSRYFTLRYGRSPFLKIGGDGGLAARAEPLDTVKLVPGERADLIFTPAEPPGTRGILRWLPTPRGFGTAAGRSTEPMMRIETVSGRAEPPAAPSGPLRRIDAIDAKDARQRDISLTITQRDGRFEMGIDGVHHRDARPIVARVGDTEVWTIRNDSDFSHPFHMHGFFFQLLDPARIPEWKDTVDVPSKSSIRIALRYDDRPGMWMYHCHILDHAEIGMMGHLQLLPSGAPSPEEKPHRHDG